jgi:DNA-binding Lrp family transcriptional regulator
MTDGVDELEKALLRELAKEPRIAVVELARRLGIARGTAQARLDRMVERGVIAGFGPELDLRRLGYGVLAFSSIEIAQGHLVDVVASLNAIPEVIEAHASTGQGDLHVRIVAKSNDDLQRVINRVLEIRGIVRTSTAIALTEQISWRTHQLLDGASD